jgi:cold shock CspA family protein
MKNMDKEQKLKQYRKKAKPNEFDIEIERLDKIFEVLDKKTQVQNCEKGLDIDVQLKNYVIYRLVSFFDYKAADTITSAIDGSNENSQTYGQAMLKDEQAIQKKINNFVILIFQERSFNSQNNDFSLNFEAEVMKFLYEVIQIINPDLKNYFEEEHQSNWITFLTNIKQNRNILTHEFTDVTYSLKELKSIMNLMKIFCFAFPLILKILIQLINQQTMNQKIIEESLVKLNLLESIHAKLVDTDSFFNLFQQHFDQEVAEKNFEKNKQSGTFKGFNPKNPSFGFIKREGDEDLFVYKTDVKGTIKEGDSVEFLVGVDKKGKLAAKNLRSIV